MKRTEIQFYRLLSQQICGTGFSSADELVHWLGGIQAQDYSNAKWSIGVRISSLDDERIEKSIHDKFIIRTWMFRGTLHFVDSGDSDWLLKLLANRILHAGEWRNRQLGLDKKILKNCLKLLDKILTDGLPHTREDITKGFHLKGMKVNGIMLSHILQYSALNGQICFGPKEGSQFTYILLDQIPVKKHAKTHEEALNELAFRYFRSHGPATINDFIWWSGLSVKDAYIALENIKPKLMSDVFHDSKFWMTDHRETQEKKEGVHLLPAFDSYLIAYRDRSIYLDDMNTSKVISQNGIFRPIIVCDGKIVGIWRRILKNGKLIVEAKNFSPASGTLKNGIVKCAEQFAGYLKKELSEIIIK